MKRGDDGRWEVGKHSFATRREAEEYVAEREQRRLLKTAGERRAADADPRVPERQQEQEQEQEADNQIDRPLVHRVDAQAPSETAGQGPKGIGGWLILPMVGLAFSLITAFIAMTERGSPLGFAFSAASFACAAVASWLSAGHSKYAPRAFLILYGLWFANGGLALLFGSPFDGPVMRSTIGPAIWIGYFLTSKRVRNTFVEEHSVFRGVVGTVSLAAIIALGLWLAFPSSAVPSTAAVEAGAQGPTLPTDLQWTRAEVVGGRVSVLFPGEPTPGVTPLSTGTMNTLEWERGECFLNIGDLAMPPEHIGTGASVETVLNGARDGAIASVGGTLLQETRGAVSGFPARDLVMSANEAETTVEVHMIVILSGLHLISLGAAACSPEVSERFVASVQVSAPPAGEMQLPAVAATPRHRR